MMYAPYFSVPLLALIAFTALFRSNRLIELIAILCVLPVASALDLSFGEALYAIPPCLLAALILLPLTIVHGHLWGYAASIRTVIRLYSPLLWFTVFAVASSVVVPVLLAGEYQTAQMMNNSGIVPLAWGRMNITQSVYVVVLTAFAIVVSCELAGRPEAIRKVVNAFMVCGYLAGLIAAYHFCSDHFGWYFPFDLLYSRPEARGIETYVRQFQIGGISIRQVFGSFSEPSTLAQFMMGTAFGSCYWWIRGGAPRRVKGLAILSVATLLATVSTTAYAGLAIGSLALIGHLAMSGKLRLDRIALGTIGLISVALVWGFAQYELSDLRALANNLLDLALFTKRDTISFQVRWLVDSIALDGFLGTYGLGLGWGSTRGSSLLIHLLGNAGVTGILFLILFARKLRQRLRGGAAGVSGFVVANLCGHLLGGAIAVPDINSVALWLLVGLTVAVALTPTADAGATLRRHAMLRRDVRLQHTMPVPADCYFPVPVSDSDPRLRNFSTARR